MCPFASFHSALTPSLLYAAFRAPSPYGESDFHHSRRAPLWMCVRSAYSAELAVPSRATVDLSGPSMLRFPSVPCSQTRRSLQPPLALFFWELTDGFQSSTLSALRIIVLNERLNRSLALYLARLIRYWLNALNSRSLHVLHEVQGSDTFSVAAAALPCFLRRGPICTLSGSIRPVASRGHFTGATPKRYIAAETLGVIRPASSDRSASSARCVVASLRLDPHRDSRPLSGRQRSRVTAVLLTHAPNVKDRHVQRSGPRPPLIFTSPSLYIPDQPRVSSGSLRWPGRNFVAVVGALGYNHPAGNCRPA